MNFEDESYVRLYTRDTATWNLLGWEGQTVLLHMLRDKFDRAGVFDLGCHEPSRAVTAVTRLPEFVTSIGVAAVLREGVWVVRDGKLVWPKYVEAQRCKRSDRARQAESRRNRRDSALLKITPTTSQNVTASHEQSQPSQSVTLSCTELSCTDLNPPLIPPFDRDAEGIESFDPVPAPPAEPAKPKVPKAKPRSKLPADWTPNENHAAKASGLRLNASLEAERFRAHAEATGRLMASWDAAFTTWLLNANRFAPAGSGAAGQQYRNEADRFADRNWDRDRRERERGIAELEATRARLEGRSAAGGRS